jgi:methionyl-tRNA formyltransferase
MEEGLDTGPMLEKIEFLIPEDMRLHALMQQLTEDACKLTLSTIRNYVNLVPEVQNDAEATLCKKIKKSDGEVNFSDAKEVYNKYRAFEGWPGIFAANGTKFDGLSLIESEKEHEPFELLAMEDEHIIVGCGIGSLKLETIQPASKKAVSAKAYCIGRGIKVGSPLFDKDAF